MRHDDDLAGAGQPGQSPTDLHRRPASDAGVDLVEHHRGACHRGRQDHPGGEPKPNSTWSTPSPPAWARVPEASISAAGSSAAAAMVDTSMVNSASAIASPESSPVTCLASRLAAWLRTLLSSLAASANWSAN